VPPLNPTTTTNLLSTQRALLDTLTSFLTVTTHHILYLRRLYPAVSFLSARAYNYPVRQSRHPAVCNWIKDAVTAIRDQLEKNTVEKVALCIYECDSNRVLERWTFDLRSFPSAAKRDHDVPFESSSNDDADDLPLSRKVNVADLEANFRATLSRISTSAGKLMPLPEGPAAPECSFTLMIEVKDRADRPVGRLEREERKWIAAEPGPFDQAVGRNANTASPDEEVADSDSNANLNAKTHAIRRLEAGELRMEVWVEESAAKFSYHLPSTSSQHPPASNLAQLRRAKMSYGAGTEKFDPENAMFQYDEYDLEPADINRKPQGGRGHD